jgi:hypothetical protein
VAHGASERNRWAAERVHITAKHTKNATLSVITGVE